MFGVPALVLEHIENIHVDGIVNSLNIRQFVDRFNDENLKHSTLVHTSPYIEIGKLIKSTSSIIKAGVIMAVDAGILAIPDFGSQVITRTLCSLSLIFSVHRILAGVTARHFGEMMKSLEFASQHLNDKCTRVAVIYSAPSLLWTTSMALSTLGFLAGIYTSPGHSSMTIIPCTIVVAILGGFLFWSSAITFQQHLKLEKLY
ncbi:hypothetical protein EDB19DRAFT_1914883 [Suillus lakei]|nr:hypothetical protein EDB19DRAFT_1914883 [Suillus lakei]